MTALPEHPKLGFVYRMIAAAEIAAIFAVVLKTMSMAYNNELSILKLAGVSVQAETLVSYSNKLEFTAKYWTLGLAWMYFYIHVVMMRRGATGAIVPNTNLEWKVSDQKSVLTNTVEQFILSIVAQAVVISYLTPVQVTNIIPLVNVFYFVGRILFWLGYPKYRTAGLVSTMAPSSVLIWFVSYQFLKTHNLLSK